MLFELQCKETNKVPGSFQVPGLTYNMSLLAIYLTVVNLTNKPIASTEREQ